MVRLAPGDPLGSAPGPGPEAEWLGRIEAAAPGRRRESRTTAFWRAVARRADCGGGDARHPRPPEDDPLATLGHLVDEILVAFPEPEVCQAVLHCILTQAGWPTRTCHSQEERSLFGSGFLLTGPPASPARFVVDFAFPEKFHTVRQSRQLTDLLRAMPAVFVGTHEALFKCIDWCAGVVKASMVTSALEMAPWRTALQLKQGYALCRREEVCGLLGARHRTAGRPCRTGLEGAPSGVGSAAALQRFVEYLGRVLAQEEELGAGHRPMVFTFVEPEKLLGTIQDADNNPLPCPWSAEDPEPFAKVPVTPEALPARSLLGRLLVASWYQCLAVRRPRCPGLDA
eukprot:EG_transcript_8888